MMWSKLETCLHKWHLEIEKCFLLHSLNQFSLIKYFQVLSKLQNPLLKIKVKFPFPFLNLTFRDLGLLKLWTGTWPFNFITIIFEDDLMLHRRDSQYWQAKKSKSSPNCMVPTPIQDPQSLKLIRLGLVKNNV